MHNENGIYLVGVKNLLSNIYIVYELEDRKVNNPHFTAQNCLFGAVQITPDAKDKSKYKCSGYGICFDAKGSFSFGNRIDAKNEIILGADVTSYYPSTSLSKEEQYTKNNNIYVLGKTFIQAFSTDGGGHTIGKQKSYKTDITDICFSTTLQL